MKIKVKFDNKATPGEEIESSQFAEIKMECNARNAFSVAYVLETVIKSCNSCSYHKILKELVSIFIEEDENAFKTLIIGLNKTYNDETLEVVREEFEHAIKTIKTRRDIPTAQ